MFVILQDQFAKWMVVICSVNIFCRRMNHQPNILLHDNAQCVIFAHFNFFDSQLISTKIIYFVACFVD